MRKIVKIMAVTLMVISFVMPGHAADVTSQFDTYFTANAIAGVEGFHQEIKDKHILLVGEHHGIADNYNLYLALLHTFTQSHVQLVLELPPSSAYLLGEYVRSGDTALLLQSISLLQGTFGYSQEHIDFWQQVRQMHLNGRTFEVVGVDQEFQLKSMAFALLQLDEQTYTPVLAQINEAGKQGVTALMEALASMVKVHEGMEIKDKKDQAIYDIMISVEQLLDNPTGDKNRDFPLYQTFKRKVNPDFPALGVFGGAHIARATDGTSMVSMLLKEPSLVDHITTAQLFYMNSSYRVATSGMVNSLSSFTDDSIIVQHARKQSSDLCIYRLPHDALFEKEDLSLPAMYDYVMLLFNAKATTPMNKQN